MWIMVAGPYRSGAANADQCSENLMVLNRAAFHLLRAGHFPIIGVNAALPIIEAAGEEHYGEIMDPLSLELAERCDACLRIGGASSGADAEVAIFASKGLPVYYSLDEVPPG